MIEPWWPVAVLAVTQLVDGLLCWKPASFVRQCLRDVAFPGQYWWTLTPIKFTATAGLVIGLWVPYLAVLTSAALVTYFLIAISMHVGARDFGRNLFLNAIGMLLLCSAVFAFTLTQV